MITISTVPRNVKRKKKLFFVAVVFQKKKFDLSLQKISKRVRILSSSLFFFVDLFIDIVFYYYFYFLFIKGVIVITSIFIYNVLVEKILLIFFVIMKNLHLRLLLISNE
jgi:hypothetical protein